MNKTELFDFYKDLKQDERATLIWACMNVFSFETALDIVKSTTIHAERVHLYEEFDQDCCKRELELFKREQTFKDCKKPIWKKIKNLRDKLTIKTNDFDRLKSRVDELRQDNKRWYSMYNDCKQKACDFDNLKAALQLIV